MLRLYEKYHEIRHIVYNISIYKSINSSQYYTFIATILVILLIYQLHYISYPAVPGNNIDHPLGWWGWADQGLYIKAARDLLMGGFDPSVHFYPPGYPLLGALFSPLSPQHPFYIPNLLMTIGYATLFIAMMQRYIGAWMATSATIFGLVASKLFALQWVIPWTSTPSAFYIMVSIFLLDRFLRRPDKARWTVRSDVINAGLFGFSVALIPATRLSDAVVVLPLAVAYAFFLTRSLFFGISLERKSATLSIISGVSCASVPIIGYAAFNYLSFGDVIGRYARHVTNNGIYISDIPEKFYSQFLDSYAFYGEFGADWLSQIPITTISLGFLFAAIFIGPLIFRLTAIGAFLLFCATYAYSDIIPTGTFRYFNIHYFKWLFPLSYGVSLYFISGLFTQNMVRRRQSLRACTLTGTLIIAASFIGTSQVQHSVDVLAQKENSVTLLLPNTPIDFVEFPGTDGNWNQIYFSDGYQLHVDGKALRAPRDYHTFKTHGSMRLLFVRPLTASEMELDLGSVSQFRYPLQGSAQAVKMEFGLAMPFLKSTPEPLPIPYSLGVPLNFATNGNISPYLGFGWSGAEPWGRWTDQPASTMHLRLSPKPLEPLTMKMVLNGFISMPKKPFAEAEVFVNDCALGTVNITDTDVKTLELQIPESCLTKNGVLRIKFLHKAPMSPQEAGISTDQRLLNIGLRQLTIDGTQER